MLILILLTMFIGACTGNTNVVEKTASSSEVTTSTSPPFSPPGVKAPADNSAKNAVIKSAVERLDKELAKEGLVKEEEQHDVPTIVVTPKSEVSEPDSSE